MWVDGCGKVRCGEDNGQEREEEAEEEDEEERPGDGEEREV